MFRVARPCPALFSRPPTVLLVLKLRNPRGRRICASVFIIGDIRKVFACIVCAIVCVCKIFHVLSKVGSSISSGCLASQPKALETLRNPKP